MADTAKPDSKKIEEKPETKDGEKKKQGPKTEIDMVNTFVWNISRAMKLLILVILMINNTDKARQQRPNSFKNACHSHYLSFIYSFLLIRVNVISNILDYAYRVSRPVGERAH